MTTFAVISFSCKFRIVHQNLYRYAFLFGQNYCSFSTSTNFETFDYEQQEDNLNSTLGSILGVLPSQARNIAKKFPGFNTAQPQQLSATLKYLIDKNIHLERILRHPWLLLIPPEILEKRLEAVTGILGTRSVQVSLPFIVFNIPKLMGIGALWKYEAKNEPALLKGNFPSRIEYLAHHLQCSEMKVADFMIKVRRLPTTSFSKIETVLHLLIEGGVNAVDIGEDAWIFVHNTNVMKQRLDETKRRGLTNIKPWLLRCSIKKYDSYVERTLREEVLKPREENIDSFLQRQLNWSTDFVKDVLYRIPPIANSKPSRLENMISFLLSKGFTTEDIGKSPHILRHSVATVAQKLAELAELTQGTGYPNNSLRLLCKSQKHFDKFVNAYKSTSVPEIPGKETEGSKDHK